MGNCRGGVSLLTKFAQETLNREVIVSPKQVEQGIVDFIQGQGLRASRFGLVHALGFNHEFGLGSSLEVPMRHAQSEISLSSMTTSVTFGWM